VAEIFSRIARANIARMEKLQAGAPGTPSAEIICSDARELIYEYSLNGNRNKPLADESVQLIITSPPTAVRLKVEENQLVGVFGEIGVCVDGLKGA